MKLQCYLSIFAAYNQLYVKKVKEDPALSKEVQKYIEENGKNISSIMQDFLIDRSDTAYFAQPIAMAAVPGYPCDIIDVDKGGGAKRTKNCRKIEKHKNLIRRQILDYFSIL